MLSFLIVNCSKRANLSFYKKVNRLYEIYQADFHLLSAMSPTSFPLREVTIPKVFKMPAFRAWT